MTDAGLRRLLPITAMLFAVVSLTTPAGAQDTPRSGGELIFAVPSEMRRTTAIARGPSGWSTRWPRTTTRS